MTKIDPIIAVKDVEASATWYESIFECKNTHGGEHFAVLVSKNDEILICLHKWGEHEHPTMENPNLNSGNGLILYFRTENMNEIRQNVERLDYPVDEDVQENSNSKKLEFSLRDPDGYYLTISEYHKFQG